MLCSPRSISAIASSSSSTSFLSSTTRCLSTTSKRRDIPRPYGLPPTTQPGQGDISLGQYLAEQKKPQRGAPPSQEQQRGNRQDRFRRDSILNPSRFGPLQRREDNGMKVRLASKKVLGFSNNVAHLLDPFEITGIDPKEEYLNVPLLQSFQDRVGNIKSRAECGVSEKNYKKLKTAIVRGQSAGLLGQWHNGSVERQKQKGLGQLGGTVKKGNTSYTF